jgi:hypothetical protein
MIIFGLILTTFKLSIIFRGSSGSSVNWLEPKIETPQWRSQKFGLGGAVWYFCLKIYDEIRLL